MTVTDRDMGFKDLLEALTDESSLGVFVGVRAKEGEELVVIAATNELGSPERGIPSRPFLRTTVDVNAQKYGERLTAIATAIADGKKRNALTLAQRLGAEAVGDVQQTIVELRDPPNAPRTIRQKGSSNPLIDTGRLRQAQDFVVVAGSGEPEPGAT